MLSRTVYQRRRFVTSSFSSAREEKLQEGTSRGMDAVTLGERADPDSRYLYIQLFAEAVQKSLGSDGFLVARFR